MKIKFEIIAFLLAFIVIFAISFWAITDKKNDPDSLQTQSIEIIPQAGDSSYKLEYVLPFETSIKYATAPDNNQIRSIVEISGENFQMEINLMNALGISTYSILNDESTFEKLDLPYNSSTIIKTEELSNQYPDTYGYYELREEYFGTDPACTEENCPEDDRLYIDEGLSIDGFDPSLRLFINCSVNDSQGIDDCDTTLKGLKIN